MIVFGSYITASILFSVFTTAVDTIFLCYLEDLERNDGSPSRPFTMSRQLRLTMGNLERRKTRTRLVEVRSKHQPSVFTVER